MCIANKISGDHDSVGGVLHFRNHYPRKSISMGNLWESGFRLVVTFLNKTKQNKIKQNQKTILMITLPDIEVQKGELIVQDHTVS